MRSPTRLTRHVLIALIVGCFTLASTPAHAAESSSEYEKRTTSHTNNWRAANDKVRMKDSSCLDRYAESWARYLAENEGRWASDLKHRSSASLKKILKACKKRSIGENLAVGFPTGEATFNAWRNSAGHNKNMLGSSYRWTAVGAYKSNGRWWVVQLVAG